MEHETYLDSAMSGLSATAKLTHDIGEELSAYIKGQSYALSEVREMIFGAYATRTQNKGPQGTALFIGPPGVGKTEIAQGVAKMLGLPFKKFNMSSFSNREASLQDFVGINSSYRDAKCGGLTGYVQDNPACVILFDEVDKAHALVLNVLYQILDDGETEDLFLKKNISFRNTILLFTTNAGKSLYDSVDRYNYASIAENKILEALKNEKNPKTGEVAFSEALLTRFAQGRIVPFNRLNGHTLCEIVKAKTQRKMAELKKKYPQIEIICDKESLSQSLLFGRGGNADARSMTKAVDKYFEQNLYNIAQKLEEDGADMGMLSKLEFNFWFSDADTQVKELFTLQETYNVAVYCLQSEREFFEKLPSLRCTFLSSEEKISSLDYDGVILSTDKQRKMDALTCFRKVKQEEDIPVYVFTMDKACGEIDMKTYYSEGAVDVYLSRNGQPFEDWLGEIYKTIRLNKILVKMSRANKCIKYDTLFSYEETDGKLMLTVDAVNYRMENAVLPEDEATVLSDREIPNVKFSDVKGLDETAKELKKQLECLKSPEQYIREGRRLPRGFLLYGRPGVGKTLLAKAAAGEAGLPFIQCNATQFYSKWIGETESNIRKIFSTARKYAPCVVFIDEVDAIGRRRGEQISSPAYDMAVNTFLSEMDGFVHDDKRPVFVMAATNFDIADRKNGLDPAFVRRFERKIEIKLPTAKGRLEVLCYYLQKHGLAFDEKALRPIVERSAGKSPADLELLVEYVVGQKNKADITVKDLEEALEITTYGEKREWSEETVLKTSYHEAGHTLVAWLTGKTPSYVTNISRGSHGGYMLSGNDEEKFDYSKQELLDKICVCFAGREAERLIYKEAGITTGASSDIAHARSLAKEFVGAFAMYEDFLIGFDEALSQESKRAFDQAVNQVLKEQLARTQEMISQNKEALEELTKELIKENSLNKDEIEKVLRRRIRLC